MDENEQWIRLTEGCPHNCPYCYEPKEIKVFPIPKIERNIVKIMDMNLLAKPEALDIIRELGEKKVNNRVVHYHLICGVDYRFLTPDLAEALKTSRFRHIFLAWDWSYRDQYRLKDALNMLYNAGYHQRDLTVFMICNWQIPFEECFKKLYLCAVWGVKVADCYYDNQTSPNIEPIYWGEYDIKDFRKLVRKHNQLVNFKADPEITPSRSVQTALLVPKEQK